MADVTLQGVTKVFPGGARAVDGVDLEIADGELLVLVGPSGSGKTTVLRLTAGLEELTDGEISIGGRVVNDVHPMDRDIAMVFQNYALYPHMSVAENIGFGLKLRGRKKREVAERVQRTAEALGLSDLLKRKPAQLSGGQRQRVAMGRAIVRDPAAFLMDEPLSNLDAKLRVQMRTEVARLQRRLATTMVYVTHDQTEAMTLGDRVAVMRAGKLQQVGAPQELYRYPTNLFVAGFIGSPAMNFMPARLEEGKLRTRLGDVTMNDELRRLLDTGGTGREVILGVRPENFEDASLVGADEKAHGLTFDATIEVVESMGSDVFVYFTREGETARSAELDELARDSGRADTGMSGDQIVARLDAATKIREGEKAALWLDTRTIHVFAPVSGPNLTISGRAGGTADARAAAGAVRT